MVQLSFTLLPAILLALRVSAGPILVNENPITLDISRRFNFTGCSVVQSDLARINAFKNRSTAKNGLNAWDVISEPVVNQAVNYIATVGVGSPATSYDLLIDTGSSNTWVGAGKKYVVTETSTQTTDGVSVSYGSGWFSGTQYTDKLTLAPGLVIPKQSIGVASCSAGLHGVDGVLGIGPVGLTSGTLSTGKLIPTITDNLFSQDTITSNLFGISFDPTTTEEDTHGSIAFGGPDRTKFTGEINYTALTSTAAALEYWAIDQSVSYGTTSILASTAGIVDTGSTLIHLATDAFNKYKYATGAVLDTTTGLLTITAAQYAALQNLDFVIGGVTYALTPNAQIWPRSLNTAIGGSASCIYLVVTDLGTNSGEAEFDVINGYAFLERFYSVYDTGNKRIGFATTPFTTALTN
ncbi:aspartic peptidase A1 [Mycena albidolilacea]|uniref:Aspartic peptidase A1 n=1 Tax=Mycena albidolilacea TaxID=1033008 RepID=A0AAD7ABH2_9AGAR|nr:aspartic peptidase A1 [Mycena albidolilacea]